MSYLVVSYPKAAIKVLDKCLRKKYIKKPGNQDAYEEINDYNFFPIKVSDGIFQ